VILFVSYINENCDVMIFCSCNCKFLLSRYDISF
jgi:hypothetical protein